MHIGSALAAVLVHQLANVSQVRPPSGPQKAPLLVATVRQEAQPQPADGTARGQCASQRAHAGAGQEALAIATIITDEDNIEKYIQGAVALGASLLEHLTLRVDKLLLVRENLTLPQGVAKRLEAVGWSLGEIPTIIAPHPSDTRLFAHQFSKLALWNLTRYSRILYMDADTFALGNLDPAFDVVLEQDQYLAAVRDFRNGRVVGDFNMGVAVLRPNKKEYERLLDLLMEDKLQYQYNWAEQGFLRAVYPEHAELPLEFNGNVACEHQRPDLWNVSLRDMRVVHFTLCKPWKCRSPESRYCGQYNRWKHYLDRGELLSKQKARKPRRKV